MEEPTLKSMITGRTYKLSDMVRITNMKQVTLYMKNCIRPYHIYCDQYINSETGEEDTRLAFLFDRSETKWAYDLWQKRELR